MTRRRRRDHATAKDGGQITAFVVVMAVALVLLVGLVLDGGLTLAARERAIGLAQEAARAGAQGVNLAVYRQSGNLVLSPALAQADAQRYLASTDTQGTVHIAGNLVTVTVTITQKMQVLDAAGLSAVTVRASASSTPDRGILGEIG